MKEYLRGCKFSDDEKMAGWKSKKKTILVQRNLHFGEMLDKMHIKLQETMLTRAQLLLRWQRKMHKSNFRFGVWIHTSLNAMFLSNL